MSIYATWLCFADDEHHESCAVWDEVSPGVYAMGNDECSCGQPDAPLTYQGSHVLPSDDDPRGGSLLVCAIPDHISHDDRPDVPEGTLKDWLRVSLYAYNDAVVLTRPQVERLRNTLTAWLGREETA